jgi:ribonuclease T1
MGRAPRTADRLSGRPRPLRWAALLVVLALLAGAVAALDLLSGTGPLPPGAGTTSITPSVSVTGGPTANLAVDPESGLPTIRAAALPKLARATLDLISVGGPFPYAEDGTTFHNLEGLLPPRSDGYYREYTVETPGLPDRGPRRLVAGARGERYWTDDHYASFWRIVP